MLGGQKAGSIAGWEERRRAGQQAGRTAGWEEGRLEGR
jgi:hypothetical protein